MDRRGHDTWKKRGMIHGEEGKWYMEKKRHDTWTGGDIILGQEGT